MLYKKQIFTMILSILFSLVTSLAAINTQEEEIILHTINEVYGTRTSMKRKELYHKLARKLHPDKPGGTNNLMQVINAEFQSNSETEITINEAKARISTKPKQTTPPTKPHTYSTNQSSYNQNFEARQSSYTAPKSTEKSSYNSPPARNTHTQSSKQETLYTQLLKLLGTGIVAFVKWIFQEKASQDSVKAEDQELLIVMPSRLEKEAEIKNLLPSNLAPETIEEILIELKKIKMSTPSRIKSESEKINYILESPGYQAFATRFNITPENSTLIITIEMKFREKQKKANAAADDFLIKTNKIKSARRTRILTAIGAGVGVVGLLGYAQRSARH